MKAMHKTRKITAIFCGFTVVVLSTLIFSGFFPAQASLFKKKTENFATLSGFEPGAKVSYRIFSQDGTHSFVQDGLISDQGILDIAAPENMDAFGSHVAYDVAIDQSEETLRVLFRLDGQRDTVSIEGQGAEAFSQIEIGTDNQKIKTGTDWAGLFEEAGIQDAWSQEQGPVRLAFYSRNIASDALPEERSAVIEIQWAPGGGGPTSAGVNVFLATVCGNPPHSYCNAGRMNQQIQNVVDNYVHAMQFMAEQISAVAMQQTAMVGMFLDAKNQMETQRLHQQLKARAVKDYHPSEQMCRIGSYIRSLPDVEQKTVYDHLALSDILTTAFTNQKAEVVDGHGKQDEFKSRYRQFRNTYCDIRDHDGGLDDFCDHDLDGNTQGTGAQDSLRINKDIDFQRTVDANYTLDIDFTNGNQTDDEEDVIALAKNLYWPVPFNAPTPEVINKNSEDYMKARRLIAFNNLAQNSYSKLVSLKSRAPDREGTIEPGWMHMKTMLREFGLNDDDIEDMIGENPSYDAQMAVLTKKIYQNPDFYTNLYNKPVNIERVKASLEAIKLMQSRDHYNASLRREMLLSAMIEENLIDKAEKIHATLIDSD